METADPALGAALFVPLTESEFAVRVASGVIARVTLAAGFTLDYLLGPSKRIVDARLRDDAA